MLVALGIHILHADPCFRSCDYGLKGLGIIGANFREIAREDLAGLGRRGFS